MGIIAFANNDMATIAWSYDQRLAGCLGFAIYRIDDAGHEQPLPAMAVFPGEQPEKGRTTEHDPVQKYYWKDLYAQRGGTYRYKVAPMEGTPGNLKPMALPALVSNPVTLTADLGDVHAYFNRGIVATQRIAEALTGGDPHKHVSAGALKAHIVKEGDPLRQSLAGEMLAALLDFVDRTKNGGDIYAALYELSDQELLDALKGLGSRLHIVLSNPRTATNPDTNSDSRQALADSHADKYDRMLGQNQIGHNKFLVYVDGSGVAQAVLFGSTNWSSTGLCTQTNNTAIVESPELAARYLEYWNRLRDDTVAAGGNGNALQGKALRTSDTAAQTIQLQAGATGESWFSPNTPKLRGKPGPGEARPPDMQEVFDLIAQAKNAVLFLAFEPGAPSIIDACADAQKANPGLFVRGCVTAPDAAGQFYVDIHGMTAQPGPQQPGNAGAAKPEDARVVAAKGVKDLFGSLWQDELTQVGFAIIHDKIVVIDPFSDNPIVITGSHNLGYRASYNNDENLVIFRGHRRLAQAYATHILDVYDHFVWRFLIQQKGFQAAQTMLCTDDHWQDRFFDANGKVISAQMRFWMAATASAPA